LLSILRRRSLGWKSEILEITTAGRCQSHPLAKGLAFASCLPYDAGELIWFDIWVKTVNDGIDTVRPKVAAIFAELVRERAKRLDGSVVPEPAMSAIASALAEEYGEKARDIAFHMADWNWDAAFVVAVHLFPERFTPDEIAAGVGLFLVHAPNHIRAACGLTGQYVWESFPDDDES